jgi:hypothetical protein
MTRLTPPPTMQAHGVRPHRGVLVLVLGILGIGCCGILAVIAWLMGAADLKAMSRGEMDASGEGLTRAGKICGIIGVVVWIVGAALQVVLMMMGIGLSLWGGGP